MDNRPRLPQRQQQNHLNGGEREEEDESCKGNGNGDGDHEEEEEKVAADEEEEEWTTTERATGGGGEGGTTSIAQRQLNEPNEKEVEEEEGMREESGGGSNGNNNPASSSLQIGPSEMLLAVETDEFQPQTEEEGEIGPTAADVDGTSSSGNVVGMISGSRRRDEANMFQAFFQMAFAAIMTLWLVSRALFLEANPQLLPAAPSPESVEAEEEEDVKEDEEKTMSEREEMMKKEEEKGRRKRTDSSSSSSSESSSQKEEEKEAKIKSTLRIDSQLLHTDTMPMPMPKASTEEETEAKREEGKIPVGEEQEEQSSVPESPPIQIETIGVRKDHIREQMLSSAGGGISDNPFVGGGGSPFLFFPMGPGMGRGEEEEEEGRAEEEEDEGTHAQYMSRLDAIVEEDSDELRSAQSSRASTARAQSQQKYSQPTTAQKSPLSAVDEPQSQSQEEGQQYAASAEEIGHAHMHSAAAAGGVGGFHPFQFLFRRQESAGGSSQSSVAKVVELSTPEEEEGEEEGIAGGTGKKRRTFGQGGSDEEGPKVPRLDLAGVSPEASEEGEQEAERTTREGEYESSPSETDTVLIVEPEEEELPEEEEDKADKADKEAAGKMDEKLVGTSKKKEMMMFPHTLHHHPADADRDQGEVFASLADQQIPLPIPMEEGRLSSPSMSINLDRSRDSLDHSICSNPTRDEQIQIPAGGAIDTSPTTAGMVTLLRAHSPAEVEEVGTEAEARIPVKQQVPTVETIVPMPMGVGTSSSSGRGKQSEKASSTSSSTFGVEEEEEEEEPMPLPPPPPPPPPPPVSSISPPKVASATSVATAASLALSPPTEKAPPPPPPFSPVTAQKKTTTPAPAVTPLWGRNERLVSYLHGYRTDPTGGPQKVATTTIGGQEGGEGKENGMPEKMAKNGITKNGGRISTETTKRMPRMDEPGWTVHPIALKEKASPLGGIGPRIGGGGGGGGASYEYERHIQIQREPPPPYLAREWEGSRHSLKATTIGGGGRGGDWTTTMTSELPPLPPLHPPIGPPLLYAFSSGKPSPSVGVGAYDHSRESSIRDDFMSSAGAAPLPLSSAYHHQPRAANGHIREIPIQRSASAFAPSAAIGGGGAGMAAPISSSSRPIGQTTAYGGGGGTGGGAGHNEYYRREVLTRTLVTRSTEALSAPPPLSRSSPIVPPSYPLPPLDIGPPPPPPRDEVTEEYWIRYSRNVEEEERRIRMDQERRRQEEIERRRRIDEQKRRWELQEEEVLERMRREREKLEKELESKMIDKIRAERDRVEKDRLEREAAERRRREEWDRIERDRRAFEEAELEKRREMERLERERLERERMEAERREREKLEALRKEQERLEQERLEHERIERERIEIERLEIERIERIKREQREKEERERERQRQEAERIQKEREELERLERERLELERQAKEILDRERAEEAEREKERERERREEAKRREEERIARERLERAERESLEREMARRAREKAEQDRLEALRREQERLAQEQMEAERRERERMEEERRERELIDAAILARERRENERRDEEERERRRQEEERLEYERRQRERIEAQQRERERQIAEQQERDRMAQLEAAAAERRAQRAIEEQRQRERLELDRRAEEMKEMERREQERRERERERLRAEEERRLVELRELEQRNAELRDRERREAAEREERRRREGWRSRELLEQLARERDEKAQWETEKRRLLAEHEAQERKRQALTSKETLERLTRKPYYSREDLNQPDVTTKVERQVIERVDRTLWTDDHLRPASSAVPGGGAYYAGGDGTAPNDGGRYLASLLDSAIVAGGPEEPGRERLYQSRADDPTADWFRRGGSTRTSKYRQRMERARREFLGETGNDIYDPTTDRFRKSTEDLLGRRRVDYRGPLLQKFNSGEFTSYPTAPLGGGLATGLGRSPYEQHAEDVNRSKSVLDAYNNSPRAQGHNSRREMTEQEMENSHIRSKSADYLTDPRRPREESTIPENELQKGLLGEHELHFRKSTERMHAPEWYRDYGVGQTGPTSGAPLPGPIGPPSATTSGVFSTGTTGMPYGASASGHRPWSYLPPSSISPVGGISFPPGMFDKYKNEIEDLRRSRTSLHQLGGGQQQDHTKVDPQQQPSVAETTMTREYSREAFSKTEVVAHPGGSQHQPGYTVYTVPSVWDMAPKERQNSRVVEVADTFVDRSLANGDAPPIANRYGGRLTLEEALDALFQSSQPIPEPPPTDPSNPEVQPPLRNADGPGIFSQNQALMDRLSEQPQMAEQLLKNEPLFIRCAHCQLVRPLNEARGGRFCWCRHCYTYYCSRGCRQRDWDRHRDRCSFARINSLCKEVIMKVRRDPETQFHMSRVAREGHRREGRGSVNIRLISAYSAQLYLDQGWRVFAQHDPNQLLFYYPIQALVDQRKEPSLIQLCRKYNPNEKFILSVSIIADIEQCPETPPPMEPRNGPPQQGMNGHLPQQHQQQFSYGTAVPTNV